VRAIEPLSHAPDVELRNAYRATKGTTRFCGRYTSLHGTESAQTLSKALNSTSSLRHGVFIQHCLDAANELNVHVDSWFSQFENFSNGGGHIFARACPNTRRSERR
jgi:hypothetical protein